MIKLVQRSGRKQRELRGHGLTPALNRIREIREHSHWEPLTDAATISERGERVAQAREQITIPPLGSEHGALHGEAERARRELWRSDFRSLLYGTALMVIGFALVIRLAPERKPPLVNYPRLEYSTIAFSLPTAANYASLTAEQAREFTLRALRAVGLDPDAWSFAEIKPDGPEPDFERLGIYETLTRFNHGHYTHLALDVTVMLDPTNKYIVCTLTPK